MKQKKIKSCVFKRDWKNYKTCYECSTRKKCTRSDKPKWYERIIEQLVVSYKRYRISRALGNMFGGISRKSFRRVIDAIKKTNKQ